MSSLVGNVQTTPTADISSNDSRQEYSNSIDGPPTSISNPDQAIWRMPFNPPHHQNKSFFLVQFLLLFNFHSSHRDFWRGSFYELKTKATSGL
jgi:hypothetical protein